MTSQNPAEAPHTGTASQPAAATADLELAAHRADLAYVAACALGLAPQNRWAAEWAAFKARAKALRLAGDLAGAVAVAEEAAAHFVAEAERHRALDFSAMCAVADADKARSAA